MWGSLDEALEVRRHAAGVDGMVQHPAPGVQEPAQELAHGSGPGQVGPLVQG